MSSFNKIILLGNLTRDPELRFIPSGAAVATFGLAVNNPRVENEVMFIDVTVWNKPAENCAKYLTKGNTILIEGRLSMESWEDKQTGQKRSKHKIVAESVQFIRTGKGGNQSAPDEANAPHEAPPFDQPPHHMPRSAPNYPASPSDMPDDDIPF
ncbi:single-stranded DNA-binding protein [Chrysiogenes arsenatis]|uniref:single-stranded DNA-binding protein n=1 Tax=Chrysiogenes arsenatis TaxID=309797 RepID=UPI0004067576|nr:single-stranded DNA-binding protein [Chrysiogenes arsenatis]